jgi:phosphate-selective porin OprO/OprP
MPPTSASGDPLTAPIRRAAELNEALARSGMEDRIGGSLEFIMVTDDALTLRRTWPYPLAVAVRGITLDVDVSTGEVLRTGPLGVELPEFESAQRQDTKVDESEVLEERRRGAEVEAPSDKTGFWWDYGPRYDGPRGNLSLFLGGRLHLDAATFSDNEELNAAFGEPDPGVSVRRSFLELGGVYKQLDFNFWVNFYNGDFDEDEPDNFSFRNLFVGMNGVPAVGSVRVGYFKEPFGLEETTSSNDISFMERSLTDAFVERRNLGVMAQRRFTEERRMTAALGVYRDANNNLETGSGYGVTGRVTGAPILAEDGRRVLHLGLSATYRDPGADGLSFSQKPESFQAQVLADTGTFAAEQDVRLGLELGAVRGSLSFQSEAIVARSQGVGGAGDPTFWSTYLMGSYVLTGEHRSYRDRVGAFGSVHPEGPFWNQGRGAVELVGRYSYLDLNSAGIDGGRLQDGTLGLNWYANRNMRVMVNYIAAYREGFDVEQIFQIRLQLTL